MEAAYSINRFLTVRAQGAFLGFGVDVSSGGVTYHGDLHNYTGGGLVDLHPFANPFFFSGGVVSGERRVTGNADPLVTATITVDGIEQRVSQNVPLHANIALGDTAPFAGLGFDNTFTHRGHWGFRAVGGVLFGQNPDATLTTSSPYLNGTTGETAGRSRRYLACPLSRLGLPERWALFQEPRSRPFQRDG